jgi:FMN phosphatase YigB (HAD superfamily)
MFLNTKVKVIAFDFDQTIIKSHSIMNYWTPELVLDMSQDQINKVTSDLFNWDKFIMFLKQTYQTGRVKYIIASYGSNPVIATFLYRLGINQIFDHILTPSKFGLLDGYNVTQQLKGKNIMLNKISQYYSVFHPEILLIDDTQINIDLAKATNFATIKVDPQTALTRKDGLLIVQFIKEKVKIP